MEARNDSGHGRAHVHESHETLGDEEGPTQVACRTTGTTKRDPFWQLADLPIL